MKYRILKRKPWFQQLLKRQKVELTITPIECFPIQHNPDLFQKSSEWRDSKPIVEMPADVIQEFRDKLASGEIPIVGCTSAAAPTLTRDELLEQIDKTAEEITRLTKRGEPRFVNLDISKERMEELGISHQVRFCPSLHNPHASIVIVDYP